MEKSSRYILLLIALIVSGCESVSPVPETTITHAPSNTPFPTPSSTSTLTPSPSATKTIRPSPTPRPTATPFGGADSLFLGFWECKSTGCQPRTRLWDDGKALRLNLQTGEMAPIGETGYMLEDVSPDGHSLLMSDWTNLYVTDLLGDNPVLIATNLLDTAEIAAYWLTSGDIAFIGTHDSESFVFLVSPDGTNLRPITDADKKPIALIPTRYSNGITWEEGWISGERHYTEGLRITSLEGELLLELPNAWILDTSLSGDSIAYIESIHFQVVPGKYKTRNSTWILDLTNLSVREISIPNLDENAILRKFKWTPDGQKAIVVLAICRPVSASRSTCDEYRSILIDLEGNLTKELPEQFDYAWTTWFWSPDGKHLFTYRIASHDRINLFVDLYNLDIGSLEIPESSAYFQYIRKEFDRLLFLKRILWVEEDPYPWSNSHTNMDED